MVKNRIRKHILKSLINLKSKNPIPRLILLPLSSNLFLNYIYVEIRIFEVLFSYENQ